MSPVETNPSGSPPKSLSMITRILGLTTSSEKRELISFVVDCFDKKR
jgi:hypothetical protein